jgi:hypothetical protein
MGGCLMLHKYPYLLAGVGVAFVLAQSSTARAQAGPHFAITKSHTGNFTVGVNGVYTIVVSNIGQTASTADVSDELRYNGFTYVSATGADWSCDLQIGPVDSHRVICSTSGAIAPGESASPITLTVIPTLSGTLTNIATGTGVDNAAEDVTIVIAAVPTLPEWAMLVLIGLLAWAGLAGIRRRTT